MFLFIEAGLVHTYMILSFTLELGGRGATRCEITVVIF